MRTNVEDLSLAKQVAQQVVGTICPAELPQFERAWQFAKAERRVARRDDAPHFFDQPLFQHLLAPVITGVCVALVPIVVKAWRKARRKRDAPVEAEVVVDRVVSGPVVRRLEQQVAMNIESSYHDVSAQHIIRMIATTSLETLVHEDRHQPPNS